MVRIAFNRLRRPLSIIAGIAAMAVLLAWLMGAFHDRVAPDAPTPAHPHVAAGARHTVQLVRVPRTETAVGSIRAVHETAVASRILGRVASMSVRRAGQPVQRDELLVELESSDLQAGLEQAEAAHRAAATHRDKAALDLQRSEQLMQQGIAAPERVDSDRAAFTAAAAETERAQQAVAAAQSALQFATIRSPIGGIVVDKRVDVGDIVQPGQLICTIYDPEHLQLVANVREELAGRLQIGQTVAVTLDALGKQCEGRVAEIVPDAQARTRSFEVKVTGPCQPGVVTGMFGRLHVPIDDRLELQVPASAVHGVGQLDFVYVVTGDEVERRYVRSGRRHDDSIEILTGLAAGEVVLLEARR